MPPSLQRKYLSVVDTEIGDGEMLALASTWEVDRVKDRVMPGAYTEAVSRIKAGQHLPLIWGHDAHGSPSNFVGEVIDADETTEGLQVHARFDLDDEAGRKAYRLVKRGSVRALSIGYRVLDQRRASGGVTELIKIELSEVSLVLTPANEGARILAVKADDTAAVPTVEELRQREYALHLDPDVEKIRRETRDQILAAMGAHAEADYAKSLRAKAERVAREHGLVQISSFEC